MTAQLNENNVWLTREAVEEMFHRLQILDFTIHNLEIYQKAFVHRSYVRKNVVGETPENVIPFQLESNEVLEFEGDSVLGGYVARYLHHRYPQEQEGFLTTLKSRLVKTESLSKFATFLGFGKYLIISKYVEEQGGRENPKLLENTFEAFIGACYSDNGGLAHDPLSLLLPHRFLRNIMEMTVNFGELNQVDDNYKDQLMRAFHQHFKGRHATYCLLKTEGQTNNCTFTCGVQHPLYPDVIVSQATGKKKPIAEQAAAKIALEKLDWIINYNNNGNSPSQRLGDQEPETSVESPRTLDSGFQRKTITTTYNRRNWDHRPPTYSIVHQYKNQNQNNINRNQQRYNLPTNTGYQQRITKPITGYNGQFNRRNTDRQSVIQSSGYHRISTINEFAPDDDYYMYNN